MGKRFDAERAAVLIFHLAKQGEIFLQGLVVRFRRIVFHDGDHRRRIHKAREIVDVAVRVIAGDAVFEPQNIRDAEIVAEDGCQFLARNAGIARLNRTQQAFLGREHRAQGR